MSYFSAVIGKVDQFKDSAAPSQGSCDFGQSLFFFRISIVSSILVLATAEITGFAGGLYPWLLSVD